jgi:dihydrofolate reductase / thymidylate synthase
MGRKTWESLPEERRPLPNRLNVILTRNQDYNPVYSEAGIKPVVHTGLDQALASLSTDEKVAEIFLIGGQKVFEEALSDEYRHLCKLILTTRINKEYKSDVFMPEFEDKFDKLFISQTYSQPKDGITFDYCFHGNRELLASQPELVPTRAMDFYPKHQEMQYLETIREVMKTGAVKGDRTGTGIVSKFGYQMRYDLSESFPLLTTKDVYWRGVAEELIWFINGNTNAKDLHDKKVKIWDGNASREFLDQQGLFDREEWDLGPVYGFQWRHFGAEYKTMHDYYPG